MIDALNGVLDTIIIINMYLHVNIFWWAAMHLLEPVCGVAGLVHDDWAQGDSPSNHRNNITAMLCRSLGDHTHQFVSQIQTTIKYFL